MTVECALLVELEQGRIEPPMHSNKRQARCGDAGRDRFGVAKRKQDEILA